MPSSNPSTKKRSSLKTLLIILGAAVLVFVVVMIIGRSGGKNQTPATGLVTQSSSGQVSAGSLADTTSTGRRSDELVALLQSVSSIDLDDSIFRNPTFNLLRDINSTLANDRNPGRENPFLPIGQDSALDTTVFSTTSTTTPSSTTTTTEESSDTTPVATGESALQDFISNSESNSSEVIQ
ncbi:hypothetical protein H6776_01015 [Candidatus Nomurabacteria bacterium]|nr:hypothetical protein [Candidatus Nomurabacteria bacterium]